MNSLLDFKLIGVGEFSHGIQQSWEFRFKLLKLAMRNTRKKIFIFNEMSVWQAENVMNDTIFSRETNKVVPFFESKFIFGLSQNKEKQFTFFSWLKNKNVFLSSVFLQKRNQCGISECN